MITLRAHNPEEIIEAGYSADQDLQKFSLEQVKETLLKKRVVGFYDGDACLGMVVIDGSDIHLAVKDGYASKCGFAFMRLLKHLPKPIYARLYKHRVDIMDYCTRTGFKFQSEDQDRFVFVRTK